jgi:hypothetical protein
MKILLPEVHTNKFLNGKKYTRSEVQQESATHLNAVKWNIPPPFNPLNAELNPICHLLALLGANHKLHVSRIRVKIYSNVSKFSTTYCM